MDISNHNAAFLEHLKRFRSAWRRGLVLALILRLAGWIFTVVAFYFVADFFLALDETVRGWLNILSPLGLAVAAAPEAVRIARLGLAEAAQRTDQIGKHRRKDVLTAWELLGSSTQDAALPAFLAQRSIGDAVARLAGMDPDAVRPHDLLARRGRLLGIQALIALAVFWSCGTEAFLTIGPRLL